MPSSSAARDLGQAGLGVAHGRGIIAVDIAEIALAVDQRVALGEILGEADHRVVDRDWSPCGWNLPMTSPTTRAHFLKPRRRVEPELAHGVEEAAVDRLQPVAHIGQRPVHDGGEGIGEIALLKRVPQLTGSIGGGARIVSSDMARSNRSGAWPQGRGRAYRQGIARLLSDYRSLGLD